MFIAVAGETVLFAVLSRFTLLPLFLVRYLKHFEAAKATGVYKRGRRGYLFLRTLPARAPVCSSSSMVRTPFTMT